MDLSHYVVNSRELLNTQHKSNR